MEDLLKEKDNQLDMARSRLSSIQEHHSSSEGALTNLEEAISDKDKHILQLKEQRDRAERDRLEEQKLHEKEIKGYKMKINALESEIDKIHVRYNHCHVPILTENFLGPTRKGHGREGSP